MLKLLCSEIERGRWMFITLIPKFLYCRFLLRWLNNFGWFLIGWFIRLNVQTFQPLIVKYRSSKFVYHDRRCTSICRSLSYPFRSLNGISFWADYFLWGWVVVNTFQFSNKTMDFNWCLVFVWELKKLIKLGNKGVQSFFYLQKG